MRSWCELLHAAGLHDTCAGYRLICGCDGEGPAAALAAAAMTSGEAQPRPTQRMTSRPKASTGVALSTDVDEQGSRAAHGLDDVKMPAAPGEPGELSSWVEAYAALGLRASSAAALVLSYPLTLFYALRQVLGGGDQGIGRLEACDEVVVHVLGASDACEGCLLEVYAQLLPLLPLLRCTRLRIEMLGPQLSADKLPPATTFTDAAGASVTVIYASVLYHAQAACAPAGGEEDRQPPIPASTPASLLASSPASSPASSSDGRKWPHLALAHNAGLAEYDSWEPTVRELLEHKVPLCFTSYAEVEVLAASACLRQWCGPRVQLATELNPFRQPIDAAGITGGGAVGVPWMSNGFLSRAWLED